MVQGRRQTAAILVLAFSQAFGIATNTHIFPFIASLLLSRGVSPYEVSTLSGLAESAMSITFFLFMRLHVWAVGRLPHRHLQIGSLLCCGLISAGLGFGQHPWQIIAFRSMTGVVAIGGVLNVIVLGELVNEQTRDRAYGWFTAGSYFGFMSGAAISGYLAEPAGRVPIFGHLALFEEYPYTLPGLILLSCSVIASIAIYYLVPETNPVYFDRDRSSADDTSPGAHGVAQRLSYRTLLYGGQFRRIMSYHLLSRISYFGALGLLTTAGKLPRSIGGLDMSVTEIGTLLFITQLLVALVLVFLSGPVNRHLSLRGIAIMSSLGFVSIMTFFPVGSHLPGEHVGWLPKILWLLGQALGEIWVPKQGLALLVMYPEARARAFAVGASKQSSIAIGAVGTAGYGALFSLSSQAPEGSMSRQMVWLVTLVVALIGLLTAFHQPVAAHEEPTTALGPVSPDEQTALLSGEDPGVDRSCASSRTSG